MEGVLSTQAVQDHIVLRLSKVWSWNWSMMNTAWMNLSNGSWRRLLNLPKTKTRKKTKRMHDIETLLQVGYPVPGLFPVKFEDVRVLKCLKDSALIL